MLDRGGRQENWAVPASGLLLQPEHKTCIAAVLSVLEMFPHQSNKIIGECCFLDSHWWGLHLANTEYEIIKQAAILAL